MIWIGLIAALIVAAGTLFLAKGTRARIVVGLAGLAAVGAYFVLGKPDMPDEPLAQRLAVLEKSAQGGANIEDFTLDQIMAIAQKRALENPKDPMPHKIMGDLLAAVGRPNEAIMAYQSALRRDPAFKPAIESLADTAFKMSGRIDAPTATLYRRAFELDPADLRLGYMAAVGDWQAGEKDKANAEMDAIEAQAPEGDPRREMFKALRETFASDAPPPAGEPGQAPPT